MKKFFLGLVLATNIWALPEDSLPVGGWLQALETENTQAIKVLTIIPHGALDLAELKPNDLIVGINTCNFEGITNGLRAKFRAELANLKKYESAEIYFKRDNQTLTTKYNRLPLQPLKFMKKIHVEDRNLKSTNYNFDVHGINSFADLKIGLEILTNELVEIANIHQDAWHTEIIDHVMQKPYELYHCARYLVAEYLAAMKNYETNNTTATLQEFTMDITNACELILQTFSVYSQEEQTLILAQLPEILNAVDNYFYLHGDTNFINYINNLDVVRLSKKYDEVKLNAANDILKKWSSKNKLLNLKSELLELNTIVTTAVAGCSGPIIKVIETKYGNIVIGGTGNNSYNGNPLAIIDLGGNDYYEERNGCITGTALSISIDFEGDDIYRGAKHASVGSGTLGIGLLIDFEGNDHYSVPIFGIGAGYFGYGTIIDFNGHDRYIGKRFVQGVGLFGSGMIFDYRGNDSYNALRFSQAVGLSGGTGIICDFEGDDLYFSTLGSDCEYGEAGIYSGMSQGVGIGLRLIAAGGLGILIDEFGNDRYESGNFSQGGGYYLGTGILYNGNGDDIYKGLRYSQGFAAHQAAGAFIELNGNDLYIGQVTANHGLAWDNSVVSVYDKSGNDERHTKGLAFGAACIGSYSEFLDESGDDIYWFNANDSAGHSSMHNSKTNIAIFVDSGNGLDQYNSSSGSSHIKNNNQSMKGTFDFTLDE